MLQCHILITQKVEGKRFLHSSKESPRDGYFLFFTLATFEGNIIFLKLFRQMCASVQAVLEGTCSPR